MYLGSERSRRVYTAGKKLKSLMATCLLLLVLSRSYSLYSGEHFLFYVFVISVFSVFTYIHCAHTRSRSALLVYLGHRTGSLSGLISLSISDFAIGSVQSHHIYVFCISSLPRSVFGGPYIYLRTRRSSDPPDTSIPAASKIAQIDLRDQNYVSSDIHFVCVYTPCLYTRYT